MLHKVVIQLLKSQPEHWRFHSFKDGDWELAYYTDPTNGISSRHPVTLRWLKFSFLPRYGKNSKFRQRLWPWQKWALRKHFKQAYRDSIVKEFLADTI